jgi:hypothetical protein
MYFRLLGSTRRVSHYRPCETPESRGLNSLLFNFGTKLGTGTNLARNKEVYTSKRAWGSNAPQRKSVSPGGSTRTKRNLLRVTPAVLLQHVGGTRSTFTSCGPHPPYTFTSCGPHPPYCRLWQILWEIP